MEALETVEKERNPCYNLYLTILIASSGCFFGYYNTIFNPLATPLLQEEYKLQGAEKTKIQGNLHLMWALGATIGVISSSPLMTKFGRIRMTIVFETLAMACYASFCFKNLIILQSARALSGFVTGLSQGISQITIKELLSRRLVGTGGILSSAFLISNSVLVFSLNLLIPERALVKHWRLLLLIPFPITLIRLICFLRLGFDTPKYYFISEPGESHATMKAERVVRFIFKDEYVDAKLQEIENSYNHEKRTGVSFSSMMNNESYRKRLLVGVMLNTFQQFSGINFLMYYSTDLFDKISHNGDEVTFQMGLVMLVSSFAAMYFINKLGRRFLLSFGVFLQGVSFLAFYLLLKLDYKSFLIIPTATYIGAFAAGIGPLGMIYATDILPPKIVGIVFAVQWLFDGIISKFVPIYLRAYGPDLLFIFFGGCCFLGFIFVRMYCLESFGKSDVDIAREFKSLSWKGICFTSFDRTGEESVRGDALPAQENIREGDGSGRRFELMDDQESSDKRDDGSLDKTIGGGL